MYHTPCRAFMMLKQFIGKGYAWWFATVFTAVNQDRNVEFVEGAGKSLPTLRKGHQMIFNVDHPRDDGLIDASPCQQGTGTTVYTVAGSRFKPG